MLSQQDKTGDTDLQSTLKDWLRWKYQKPGNVFLGLVQRLDRPTRGLMVLARTSKAASRLSDQIRKRTFHKEYLAVVVGRNASSGAFLHYIGKDATHKKAVVSRIPGSTDAAEPDAADHGHDTRQKQAEMTVYHLETNGGLSLVRILLKTGRFHQIRAQLAAAGTPIAGDRKYGTRCNRTGSQTRHLALMCNKIAFEHPTRREPLSFRLNVPDGYPWNQFGQL